MNRIRIFSIVWARDSQTDHRKLKLQEEESKEDLKKILSNV